jgi:CheY-like chemotaxis protein
MREGLRAASGARILIAEDEFLVSEMICDMVAGLGYVVAEQAASLAALREALAHGRFDCVLLDQRLGSEMTVDAADILVERGVPFAFVTGYLESSEPRHAAVPVLHKPFSVDQLRVTLERLLGSPPALRVVAERKQAG